MASLNSLPRLLNSKLGHGASDLPDDPKMTEPVYELPPVLMECFEDKGLSDRGPKWALQAEELEAALLSLRSVLKSVLDGNREQLDQQSEFEKREQSLKDEYEARLEEMQAESESWRRQCLEKAPEMCRQKELLTQSLVEVDGLKRKIPSLYDQLKQARRPGEHIYHAFSARLNGELTRAQADLSLARKAIARLQRVSQLNRSIQRTRNFMVDSQQAEKMKKDCLASMQENRRLATQVERLKIELGAAKKAAYSRGELGEPNNPTDPVNIKTCTCDQLHQCQLTFTSQFTLSYNSSSQSLCSQSEDRKPNIKAALIPASDGHLDVHGSHHLCPAVTSNAPSFLRNGTPSQLLWLSEEDCKPKLGSYVKVNKDDHAPSGPFVALQGRNLSE